MIRTIARPMLASVFVWNGVETLREPQKHLASTEALLSSLRKALPAEYRDALPKNPQLVTQGLAGAKVISAVLFGLGKMPRLSATVLSLTQLVSLLENTPLGRGDNKSQEEARTGLLTDTALLGALAIIAQDTEGKPGLRWRADQASKKVAKASKKAGERVQAALPTAQEQESLAKDLGEQAQNFVADASVKAEKLIEDNRGLLDTAREKAQDFIEDNREVLDTAREKAQDFLETAEKDVRKHGPKKALKKFAENI